MPFFVEIRMNPNYQSPPEHIRKAHIAYVDENIHLVLAGGGLLDDAGQVMRGGLYILDVENRAQAETFIARDPYIKNEVFEVTQLSRWRKSYFNHERLIKQERLTEIGINSGHK